MKKFIYLLVLLLLFFLTGCSSTIHNDINLEWYPTQEEAIATGLASENINQDTLLSIETFGEHTFVFFDHHAGLGIATIPVSDKGYTWFRSSNIKGFVGDVDYFRGSTKVKTITGEEIEVIIGKVKDRSIRAIEIDGSIVWDKEESQSMYYYLVANKSVSSVNIKGLH